MKMNTHEKTLFEGGGIRVIKVEKHFLWGDHIYISYYVQAVSYHPYVYWHTLEVYDFLYNAMDHAKCLSFVNRNKGYGLWKYLKKFKKEKK